MTTLLLAALLALGPSSTEVRITPRLGMQPLVALIIVRIPEPTPDWYCPSVEITWADGTHSLHEADCEPWEKTAPEDRAFSWSRRTLPLGEGLHQIQVRLKQGKREQVHTLQVEVH